MSKFDIESLSKFFKENMDIYTSRSVILQINPIYIGLQIQHEDQFLHEICSSILKNQKLPFIKIDEKTYKLDDDKECKLLCYEGRTNGFCIFMGKIYFVLVSSHNYRKGKDIISSTKKLIEFLEGSNSL
ncbi:hypothetical protein HZS_4546 [Henneguya salminicola]|nr:hypothetical protein HZS_4546 [Henneguya salminicola]